MPENPLHLLMNPKSIAAVGASNNWQKMGTMQSLSILKDGFTGKFYPVHPKEKVVLGHKAYRSVEELPEVPDLAMLVVPASQVLPLLESFGKIGTKRAIVISAGFKETGAAGKSLESRLIEVAHKYGMRFLGPNCMGIVNSQLPLNLTVTVLEKRPGYLGMATQSGTYVTQTLNYLKKRGIRFSKAISVGNEANIDIVDALEYLGEDKETKAIILYIEGLRRGRQFIEVAQKITPHKPVLAQYVGGSTAGQKASMSHTGAMAGPDILYDGIFKQAGIIRLYSIEDLYSHGWTLATQPPLKGNRLGVVTHSGGPGTAISHTADQGGFVVPSFSQKLQKQIRQHIAPHASSANPVDMTFTTDTQTLAKTIPKMIMESKEVDGVIIHGPMSSAWMKETYPHIEELINTPLEKIIAFLDNTDFSEMVSLPWKYKIPLVISCFFGRDDNYTTAYEDNNIPVIDSPEKAARAMVSLLRHKEIRDRKAIVPPKMPRLNKKSASMIQEALKKGQKALDEYQAKQILLAYGIPVTKEILVRTEKEAASAAKAIGFSVVVKACSWKIMHKTGKGLISLNVQTQAGVQEAFRNIHKAAGSEIPILIQKQIAGNREFVVGMTRSPSFGPCVLFGLGGIFTEAFTDTTFRSAPLSLTEAQEMITDIRTKKLVGAFRGMPAVDKAKLSRIIQAVGFISLLHPEIAEIDLNPVLIEEDQPVVVDALMVLNN
jgi:acetyltransferase